MHPTSTAAQAGALLIRYLISLDDDKLDDEWARSLFTDDVRIVFPMSRHDGIDGLAEYHRDALSAFRRTQHLPSPPVVDMLDDGRVRLRANLVSTHVHRDAAPSEPLFATGSLVTCDARLTGAGWRLSGLSLRVIWTTGNPPGSRAES
jgi:hypothetical protein